MQLHQLLICLFCLCTCSSLFGQDTFSIVAVDTETGEIGSAGASCIPGAADLGGVILISDIIPGRGAINGQATVCIPHINLQNGIQRMRDGLAPQAILDWLYENDRCSFGDRESRQYGVVDISPDGEARSAAFTGNDALAHAGHRVGANYAIQGNILLGPQVLDSMESRFIRASGSLADKLMAAMQGANIPGADSRCLNAGTSSTSAFLQVYRPDDAEDAPYLRLNVEETVRGVEPIDSLQVLFDEWLLTDINDINEAVFKVFPNPVGEWLQMNNPLDQVIQLILFTVDGRQLLERSISPGPNRIQLTAVRSKGLVLYRLTDERGVIQQTGKLLIQ